MNCSMNWKYSLLRDSTERVMMRPVDIFLNYRILEI
jgi:hypothetical protein